MISLDTYKTILRTSGSNLAEIRRKQSNDITNITFTQDTAYKRCRVLTSDGWGWVDAKYYKHSTPSITKDAVDVYLQFRPGVHFNLGTYVIIPDDTSPKVNTPEDPFDQPYEERTQWWLIVDRTDANQFVQYSALRCNWDFQWIYNGEIKHCYGCVRNSNSYTSGEYLNDKTLTLDNITSGWLPDVYYTYKNIEKLGLDDTRSLDYGMRFMISDNSIHPKTYHVSKVTELVPAGIIKLTMKQVPYDDKRDNVTLRICDYYDATGVSLVNPPEIPNNPDLIVNEDKIKWMFMNDDGELSPIENSDIYIDEFLHIKKTSYFLASFAENADGDYAWTLDIVDELEEFSQEEKIRLLNYID